MHQEICASARHIVFHMPHAPKSPGWPSQWPDKAVLRFSESTFGRLERVLIPGKHRSAFVRSAVERELERREAQEPRR